MKKVLVLVAVIALTATAAIADQSKIVNTKHNITAGTGTTEVCVFCHTPHRADITVTKAPLWNRTNANATNTYNSKSMLAQYADDTARLAAVNQTDAPLCLSCHAGNTELKASLINPPNGATMVYTAIPDLTTDGNIGTALNNDHPIGMNYVTAQAVVGSGLLTNTLPFFNDIMWCSSCHNVHNNLNAPFLRATNENSALCTTCHAK